MKNIDKKMYKDNKNILPVGGGWVSISGNTWSLCPRGLRIPEGARQEGVRHLDIYWAYDEEVPWKIPTGKGRGFAMDVFETDEDWELLCDSNGIQEDIQLSWVTLHTPSSQLIRMWRGEVRPFSEELIQELLKSGGLEIIQFGINQKSPVWDEITRDLIGSLQIDGLSYQEAQAELVRAGIEFEIDYKLPSWFFRPINWYYHNFCEEPEYEEWRKEHDNLAEVSMD